MLWGEMSHLTTAVLLRFCARLADYEPVTERAAEMVGR